MSCARATVLCPYSSRVCSLISPLTVFTSTRPGAPSREESALVVSPLTLVVWTWQAEPGGCVTVIPPLTDRADSWPEKGVRVDRSWSPLVVLTAM